MRLYHEVGYKIKLKRYKRPTKRPRLWCLFSSTKSHVLPPEVLRIHKHDFLLQLQKHRSAVAIRLLNLQTFCRRTVIESKFPFPVETDTHPNERNNRLNFTLCRGHDSERNNFQIAHSHKNYLHKRCSSQKQLQKRFVAQSSLHPYTCAKIL